MIIYIDENISPYLARGFNIIQAPLNHKLREPIEIISVKDEFTQGIQDEKWIPLAGAKGSCIITQDYNIHRIRQQQALCVKYQLGMFYFRPPSKNGFLYWDMPALMVKHWPQIIKLAVFEVRPFAFKVTSRGEIENLN